MALPYCTLLARATIRYLSGFGHKRKQEANAANKYCSNLKEVLFDPDSIIGTGVALAVLALCQVVAQSWWCAL